MNQNISINFQTSSPLSVAMLTAYFRNVLQVSATRGADNPDVLNLDVVVTPVAPHFKVLHGLCSTCGHYGDDCTGRQPTLDDFPAPLLARAVKDAREARAEITLLFDPIGMKDHDPDAFNYCPTPAVGILSRYGVPIGRVSPAGKVRELTAQPASK